MKPTGVPHGTTQMFRRLERSAWEAYKVLPADPIGARRDAFAAIVRLYADWIEHGVIDRLQLSYGDKYVMAERFSWAQIDLCSEDPPPPEPTDFIDWTRVWP